VEGWVRLMKILIVDDNEALAFVLKEMLDGEGFETKVATNGREGYFSYLVFEPDWIISDIHMPVENGLEMMKNIWLYEPTAKAIYISGDLSPYLDLIEDERSRHEVRCLEKPFSKEELTGLLTLGKGQEEKSVSPQFRSEPKADEERRRHEDDIVCPGSTFATSEKRV